MVHHRQAGREAPQLDRLRGRLLLALVRDVAPVQQAQLWQLRDDPGAVAGALDARVALQHEARQ